MAVKLYFNSFSYFCIIDDRRCISKMAADGVRQKWDKWQPSTHRYKIVCTWFWL